MLSPVEIAKKYADIGAGKAKAPAGQLFLLAIFAGMFIALAGAGASVAAAMFENPSAGKLANALIFPGGLVMVLLAGSELFTGNCLISLSVLEKKATVTGMLRSWVIVYLGNFIGSVFIAALFVYGHSADVFGGALAQNILATAMGKVSLSFSDALLRGISCNILVCIAVWIACGAKTASDKVIAVYLPIAVFVLCGFEHCIANMFSVPAGIFIAGEYGLAAEGLSWLTFAVNNLIPVTIGNILGGSVVVGAGYWLTYLAKNN